ncbi:MAG: radical SAM family RiPP maturation amino acid epimerase [Synechocystis sp.]|nr:radical SAM family RiPP maturation amino acid epimerase [Synechocystis sp.]
MYTKNALHQQDIQPIITYRDRGTPEYVKQIGEVKRLLEKFTGDTKFREAFLQNPIKTAQAHDIHIDPEEIRLLWDYDTAIAHDSAVDETPLSVQRYRAFIREKKQHRAQSQAVLCASNDPRFKAWRDRQVQRSYSQLGKGTGEAIVHAPMSLELSKGCSVGCWFCGVAAPKLSDIFFYTPENAQLWQETLTVLKAVVGPAAAHGFCYWASDPLDNPDYEKFLIDFHRILNRFPQTTTAQPMKDPQRTRDLLQLSAEKGGFIDRFSIISLNLLKQVHQEFSAEELTFVELITQNKEAHKTGKHVAGRARDFYRKQAEKNNEDKPNDAVSGTIACVSGFLFNMVDRSVKLISPCNASERWPLGYYVYQEGTFHDGESLHALLMDMINNHMNTSVRHDQTIAFRRDLKYQEIDDGFRLSSAFLHHNFSKVSDYLKELVEGIYEGNKTAGELALAMEKKHDVALEETFYNLNTFLQKGYLDEEPKPFSI